MLEFCEAVLPVSYCGFWIYVCEEGYEMGLPMAVFIDRFFGSFVCWRSTWAYIAQRPYAWIGGVSV